MARPRVFVSSTFYDLKHIRSSLDVFIESLGYDSILSEKGDIAYTHDVPPDESCYREVGTADIFVLIVGGRYGSVASRERNPSQPEKVLQRYESVTKLEHQHALELDIPIFILVEASVYSEYQTYLRNKDSKAISYAHVDSVNVFVLLESILNCRRNNPVKTFERYSEIESWLREQWAGLFREFLNRSTSQNQLTALQSQVDTIQELSKTLKTYLEEIVTKVSPDKSHDLMEKESQRLKEAAELKALEENFFVGNIMNMIQNSGRTQTSTTHAITAIREAIKNTSEFDLFLENLSKEGIDLRALVNGNFLRDGASQKFFNDARESVGEHRLQLTPIA